MSTALTSPSRKLLVARLPARAQRRRRALARPARSCVPGLPGTWRNHDPRPFEKPLSYRHPCGPRDVAAQGRAATVARRGSVGGLGERMRHVAIIGSGPAGYYTAEASEGKRRRRRIDIIEQAADAVRADPRGVPPITSRSRRCTGATRRPRSATMCGSSATSASARAAYRWRTSGRTTTRSCSRPARRPTGRSAFRARIARRFRLGGVRRLVQRPSGFRRSRAAA